jgi:rhomboid family GlyGly-CTERM serine protease
VIGLLVLKDTSVSFFVSGDSLDIFVWHSSSWLSHPWTLWTAPLVHLSAAHLLANCLAFAALLGMAFVHRASGVLRPFALGLLLVWPLSTFCLIFSPLAISYVGMSGVVHGAVALLGVLLIRTSWIGWVLVAGLAAKLYLEQAWVQPVVWSADWGFNVVVVAHLYGAGVGVIVGALAAQVPPERGADAKRGGKAFAAPD